MKIPMRTVNIGGEVFRVPDFSKVFGKGILGLVVVVGIIWLLTGIYIVGPDSQGVVRRFGKLSRVVNPGLNYHRHPQGQRSETSGDRVPDGRFGSAGKLPFYAYRIPHANRELEHRRCGCVGAISD
jgi:hypothetical protein